MTIKRLSTLVSTNWLKSQLKSVTNSKYLRVLDTTWSANAEINSYEEFYKESHIPDAKHFDLNQCVRAMPMIQRNLPDFTCFSDYVRSLGISKDTHIVCYDRNLTLPSGRTWWLFRLNGHNNVSILDGGFNKWLEDGYEVSNEEPKYEKGDFISRINSSLFRDFEAMTKNVKTLQEQMIDARDNESFMGDGEVPPNMKAGHIPGAKNIPFTELFNEDGTFKPEKDLKQLFREAGVDLGKPVVASCKTGMTACSLAVAAHILGKETLPVYYGSWMEWGQRASADLCATGK